MVKQGYARFGPPSVSSIASRPPSLTSLDLEWDSGGDHDVDDDDDHDDEYDDGDDSDDDDDDDDGCDSVRCFG